MGILGGMAALCVLAGCDPKTSDLDLVWVSPPKALDTLNTPGGLLSKPSRGVFVDPRSTKSYEEGHIPGAISLPFPAMTDTAASVLAGYDIFVVYDSDFSDVMAKAGSKRLLELGFKNVYTLEGGLKAWRKEGYEVVTGSKPR